MSQKTKIIIAFSVGIVFLLLVGLFSYRSISNYRESSKWVTHTQTVIYETQQVLSYSQDIETANRGFAITGKENYLEPFNTAYAALPSELSNLKHLTQENPVQQKLVAALKKDVYRKMEFGERVNEICRKKGFLAGQKLIVQDTGKDIMDDIRADVAEIINNEEALLTEREMATSESFDSTILFIALGCIFSVISILLSICVFVRDYNKRLKVEKEVRESESRMKQFLNALPVGVYIMNDKYVPYYANSRAKEILGEGIMVEEDRDSRQVFTAFIKGTDIPFPREQSPILRVLQGEALVSTEDIEMERDGRRFPLRVNATPVLDSEGNITYGISVFEDITEQKLNEAELIRARHLAEESSLLKEVFLANMSHEIRTPMNAIIGFATLMKDTEMSADQKEYITNISTASENLLGIINDILDISKIESGHIVLEKISFDLTKVIGNVNAIMNHKATQSKIGLNCEIDENVPEFVMGDPTRLNQVLLNLTSNAIKFTKAGEVNIRVELVGETDTETTLKFSVKDTGIGIPAIKLDSIFERFSQADSNTTRIYGGTGLGLSICKSLVELQGGTIGVESTLKEGSVFHFILTFPKVKQEAKKEIEARMESLKGNHSVRLLLVEDNVLNQKLAMKVLQNFGFKVDLAENGKVAVEKVKANTYDVILMDLQMPEMDGYQATEYIRQKLKVETPIIAMTAHSLVGEKDKCMFIGMNDYIPKPFVPGVLYDKIVSFSSDPSTSAPDSGKTVLDSDLIDLSYLRELSGGSEEFEKEMIELYLNQTPIELEILNKAIEREDFAGVKATAHKLKSSFSLMGVNENGILPWLEKQAVLKTETVQFAEKFAELKAIFDASRAILETEG